MGKIRNFVRSHATQIGVSLGIGTVAVAGLTGVASATGAPEETVFTSTQASLVTELGYGVALVIALLLIGLGVRMLIKWSKKGVTSA